MKNFTFVCDPIRFRYPELEQLSSFGSGEIFFNAKTKYFNQCMKTITLQLISFHIIILISN